LKTIEAHWVATCDSYRWTTCCEHLFFLPMGQVDGNWLLIVVGGERSSNRKLLVTT
ncbi:946_t:CDS:2, partial [Racocetra persica]